MSRAWRLVSRASESVVRFSRVGQGGVNSGRAVVSSSTRAVGLCAIKCPSSSSVETSHQRRSSMNRTSGCAALSDRVHCTSRSMVFRRCRSGLSCSRVGRRQPEKVGEGGQGLN